MRGGVENFLIFLEEMGWGWGSYYGSVGVGVGGGWGAAGITLNSVLFHKHGAFC